MRFPMILILLAMAMQCAAQGTLTVEVELNKPQQGGTVRMAVCMGEEAYDAEKGCLIAFGKAVGDVVRLELKDVPEGRYAIKAFHDVNDNGEMDFNWMGIPQEPYGFSNNASATMSAPKFEQAAFMVRKGPNVTRFRMKG